MKLSMIMIAKNEAENVEACFASFWDDVDEVVLCDTGSRDETVEVAQRYALKRGDPDKLKIGHFEWCDDFAAARNYADSLATGDWRSWIDLDDEARGVAHLRKTAEEASDDVGMLYVRYDYAHDDLGNCFCELWRERLVRAGQTEWIGRVHECQIGPGTWQRIDRSDALWVHRRSAAEVRDRNEVLLREWVEEEPDNPRAVSYLAFELMGARAEIKGPDGQTTSVPDQAKITESLPHFQHYLSLPNQPPDARAQSGRRYSQVLLTLGKLAEAQAVSATLFAECPSWPDTLLTLAEIAHEQQDWQRTIEFATQVIQKGQPDTMLIVNPEDYTLRPRVLIASAMASLGKLEEACQTAQQVIDVNPAFMGVADQLVEWMGTLAREQSASMWSNCAQILLQNDEPLKARALLDTVPYFAADHPGVVASRTRAAAALGEPYQVVELTDSPRAQFLARCLREQTEPVEVAA